MATQPLTNIPDMPISGQNGAQPASNAPSSAFETQQEAGMKAALKAHGERQKALEDLYQGDKAALQKDIDRLMQQEKTDQAQSDKLFGQMATEQGKFSYNLAKINAPQAPTQIYRAQAFKKFLPIAVAFAGLATAATHGDIAVGLQAMADGMNGYRQGNINEYNRKYQEWKDKMSSAIETNRERLQLYHDWIAKAQRDGADHLQANIELLRAGLQNLHDDVSLQGFANGSLSDITGVYNKLTEAHTRFQKAVTNAEHVAKPPSPKALDEYIPAIQNQMKLNGFDEKYDMSSPGYHNLQNAIANRAYMERQLDPTLSVARATLDAVDYANKNGWWTEFQVQPE